MSIVSMAMPGSIPAAGGGSGINPSSLFSTPEEKMAYQQFLAGAGRSSVRNFKVKKVKVEIFDLSDPARREEYERLWAELLDKSANMEVLVDHRKDLVHRADGTSYWMKYVEYVEFGDANEAPKDRQEGQGKESA